jgi:hypothetical protein
LLPESPFTPLGDLNEDRGPARETGEPAAAGPVSFQRRILRAMGSRRCAQKVRGTLVMGPHAGSGG